MWTKVFFQVFEKLHKGFQSDLSIRLSRGQTIRDSWVNMKHFSVPYECIFHLVCIEFSVNAQFLHSSLSILFARTTYVSKRPNFAVKKLDCNRTFDSSNDDQGIFTIFTKYDYSVTMSILKCIFSPLLNFNSCQSTDIRWCGQASSWALRLLHVPATIFAHMEIFYKNFINIWWLKLTIFLWVNWS